MPTFNNGESAATIRTKLNNVINRTERVMIVDDVTQLANLVYTADSQWTVSEGMQVFAAREGFCWDVLASGAATFHIQPGAVKLNLRPGEDGFFNFMGMLPAANGTTDDYPLLAKLLAEGAAPSGQTRQGPSIFFPAGNYRMNTSIELKATTNLRGPQGFGVSNFARLIFPANTTGIAINRWNTLNGTTMGTGTTGADGSSLEGLAFVGGGGTDRTKPGIWMRARCSIRSCNFSGFPGNGIQIIAGAGAGGAEEGNANSFYIENVICNNNNNHGLFVNGADANAGTIINLDCASNGRHGIFDSSFLGNVYIGCHTATNGKPFSGGNTSVQSNGVSYDGKYYLAHWDTTEELLVATEPGTNNNVWWDTGLLGAPNAQNPLWVAASPVGTYFPAFGYRSDGAVAQNAFYGCYNELDNWCVFEGAARIDGGTMPNIIVGNHLFASSSGVPVVKTMSFGQAGFGVDVTDGGGLFTLNNPTTSLPWRLQQSGTDLVMRNGNLGSRNAFFILGDSHPVPYKLGVADWVVNGYREGTRTAAPTTEFWPTGSYVRNGNVASGQPRGWRCTVGGTPGTWVADSNWP
jgi:hypothetical protein